VKLSPLPSLTVCMFVVGMSAYAIHWHAHADEPVVAAATTHVAPNQLRYPPGSPQLAYLAIDTVKAVAPPLTDPLPARIAFDEDHTVRVFSPLAGRVVQIVVKPGQAVRPGDVLAWLLAPEYDTAVADLRKAQADHDSKQAAFVRAQRLSEAGVIATRDLDSARADARSAQAEMDRASARLRSLGSIGSDGRFALRTSVSGVVAERHLNPGQELRPDATDPAFIITDPGHLDVVADVAESELNLLHVGQPIRIEADGTDLSSVKGEIASIGIAMDAATRRVPVRAHLKAAPPAARPDMFVRLVPLGDTAATAVAVPNNAIVTTGQQSFVFVEQSPGLLVKTHVDFVTRGRRNSYVSQGLQAGARVVTKGAILLDAELTSSN
jgi:membrane fusion protein, heavy metal efflux system